MLEEVGLEASDAAKYPGGFSGGQRQRIVIARALAMEPEFVVLDESVAALDVQIQRDVLELLDRIGRERKLTYLFISHDLDVVASFCNQLVILEKGRIVEAGETDEILRIRPPNTQLNSWPHVPRTCGEQPGFGRPIPACSFRNLGLSFPAFPPHV